MKIDEIRLVKKELEKILPIFLDEFLEYVRFEKRRHFFERIEAGKANQLIGFETGLGAWCKNNKIYYAIQNNEMFKKIAKNPNYGQSKGQELVSPQEFITNDKDYLDYMEYFIGNGLTELDYSLDVLPHEIMHLVGSGNGIFGEGITEYRTRQVCEKYGIRYAPVMHSKEAKLVMLLEKIVGPMELNEAAFFNNYEVLEDECDKIFGKEAFRSAYEEARISYRMYLGDGEKDPIEHYKNYRNVDFSKLYELFEAKINEINAGK